MFRICALLTTLKPTHTEAQRQLLHTLCWAPIETFTESNMQTCVTCWVWLLAARDDLTVEVCFFLLRFSFSKIGAAKPGPSHWQFC